MIRRRCSLLILLMLLQPVLCTAADWPQFRGLNRDGKSPETGLLKQWPAGGPKLLWSYEGLGDGYSTVIVADGLVYANGVIPGEKEGTLFAFDVDGNLKWKKSYGPEWAGRKPGTHCPPTFDSGRLYFMSGMCVISCLDAKTGDMIWSIDTVEKFGAVNLKWGLAEAPLIVGNKVLCTPGGTDATMVALDKMTGKLVWTTKGLSELSAYCSAQLIEWGNKRVVLTMAAKSVVFIDLENGKTLLQIPHTCKYDISAVRPVFKDGLLYVTNGYGYGGIMYRIAPDFGSDEKKWIEKELDCHHGGVILLNGDLYGAGSSRWVCLDLETGTVRYAQEGVGKGCVIWADDMLYCYGEKEGELALVKADPAGYEQVSSFTITKGTDKHWAHPVISDGRLYIRHGNALMVYDIMDRKR